MSNSRHPYTYAADYIRILAGYGEGGTKLSRSDASRIRQGIATAIGMDDADLAARLSAHYQANESALTAMAAEAVAAAIGLGDSPMGDK